MLRANLTNPVKLRRIYKCLSELCGHVFLGREIEGPSFRCPKCKNAPCGSIRQGGEIRWPLKEAKKIAAIMRGTKVA